MQLSIDGVLVTIEEMNSVQKINSFWYNLLLYLSLVSMPDPPESFKWGQDGCLWKQNLQPYLAFLHSEMQLSIGGALVTIQEINSVQKINSLWYNLLLYLSVVSMPDPLKSF